MKLLPAALILTLAAAALAQGPVPTSPNIPTTVPSTNPFPIPPTATLPLETYILQIRTLYNIPPKVQIASSGNSVNVGPGGDTRWIEDERKFADRVRRIRQASTRGIPLNVIENIGDAREQYLKNTQAARLKLINSNKDPEIYDFPATITAFNQQKTTAQLQLEVKKAKENAIQKRIADTTMKIQDLINKDDTLKALAKIESIREQQLKRVQAMVDSRIVPPGDFETAEADLAAATIAFTKRRAEIAATAFGGALDTLNRLLLEVSLDIEELQSTVNVINARLKQLDDFQNISTQISTLSLQIDAVTELIAIEKSAAPTTQP
jgi:hypothetical protein